MSECLIRLEDIVMEFDDKKILKSINLTVKDKEFVTLLGPSGCGKTTTLRIIGGFETPTSGAVYFDGKKINDVPPHKRNINTIFQKYALFPHLNVQENIAFGLKIAKVPRDEIKKRVDAARARQRERLRDTGADCNAHMGPREMSAFCALSPACSALMENAYRKLGLSARSYDRILRVARTIADLEGAENIEPGHLAEAIQYRTWDFRTAD